MSLTAVPDVASLLGYERLDDLDPDWRLPTCGLLPAVEGLSVVTVEGVERLVVADADNMNDAFVLPSGLPVVRDGRTVVVGWRACTIDEVVGHVQRIYAARTNILGR